MKGEHVPVLIVGGGPVGLSMSLLLAQQGIPALLLEKHAGTATAPRARGLNVRSMEIFRGLGLEGAIRRAGAHIGDDRYTLVVETLAGKEIRRSGGSAVEECEQSYQRAIPSMLKSGDVPWRSGSGRCGSLCRASCR
jgi:2-polyprenyl-6-methoxyphenol hydroxylase-like FAD-dependent oxidoreductase